MWNVVYVANSKENAQHIKSNLEKEGLLVNIRPLSFSSEIESGSFEVLVPKGEAEEAHEILDSMDLMIKAEHSI